MTFDRIDPEVIEAAAKASWESIDENPWDELPAEVHIEHSRYAEAAIRAADKARGLKEERRERQRYPATITTLEHGLSIKEARGAMSATMDRNDNDDRCPTCGVSKQQVLAYHAQRIEDLQELIRRAAPFVNAVAVTAGDRDPCARWMADAAYAVGHRSTEG